MDKAALYDDLARQLEALIEGEADRIANAANMAALLYHGLPGLNWAGFYFTQGDELVLGPFQGKPACVRIPMGRGVCGRAAETRETQVVPDVDAFPGHIACDSASRSDGCMDGTRSAPSWEWRRPSWCWSIVWVSGVRRGSPRC